MYLPLADAAASQNVSQPIIMIAIFVLISYFVLWRPDRKRRAKLQRLRENMKKGDVVIAMGIRATIDEVKDRTVILKQCDGSKMEMLKAAISEIEASTD
ncbi:preprotein translocase subunit YajC [bacterium]|nr:preprotein translocase subunit YajC [bacterium]